MSPDTLSTAAQISALAARYSERAEAYDRLWSPAIQPFGERLLERLPLRDAGQVIDLGCGAGALLPAIQRAAPRARVLGVDNAEGMLQLARNRYAGPLARMNAESLELSSDQFDVAVVAFVLFHLPHPRKCLAEVFRVLRPGGSIGTTTWGKEALPAVDQIWDTELSDAGAQPIRLPATENRTCCDTEAKIRELLETAGFTELRTWAEPLIHRWPADDHFEHQLLVSSRSRLESLDAQRRESVLRRIRSRLPHASEDEYTYHGEVLMATGAKPR